MSYWTKLFLIWGKLRRAHPTKSGHFAPAYLGGSNKLRASLEFLYGKSINITFSDVELENKGVMTLDDS